MNLTSRRLDLTCAGLREAQQYCLKLAGRHYENFTVILPGISTDIRQDLASIYAFARWADDLADESSTKQQALENLNQFEEMLHQTYDGSPPSHPVFLSLHRSIHRRNYARAHFLDLLSAFRQDQEKPRYQTFPELIDYCERSANPVGRLVLDTFGVLTEKRQYYADKTCSALQLTNFWADVPLDLKRGRIYLPREDLQRFSVNEDELRERTLSESVRALMAFEVQRTRDWFRVGWKLIDEIGGPLALCVEAFNAGGWAVLEKIEESDFDIFSERRTLSVWDKSFLLVRGLWRWGYGRSNPPG